MIELVKSVVSLIIGFIFSTIFGLIIIPILKKNHINQTLNRFLERTHKSKKNTPTMGGIIFIIPTILITTIFIMLKKISLTYNLIIIIFTLISYSIVGFIDDYLIIKKHNNKGLSKTGKFVMQVIIAIIFFYLFMKAGNEPLLWIHTLKIKKNIGWLYGIIILFILTASSNAVNLTDGLDGLAGGLSVISLTTFGIIVWFTDWLLGYEDIAVFTFVLIGSLLGFLIYNAPKAQIFMGDTGSLSLGATLGAYSIITRHEILLILIGLVFVIETATTIIQIIVYKITKKRVFKMTPIHHTFELNGWKEENIVKLFWVIGFISCMISLIWGVVL
ncbi:MAG: phospho-N-acetylmuramoyl-pentapeptide-transferase [Bacilli bacterium]|nr:phospho-N-acetylmuramoyl-pentapeptide-transferase [Bacilli bacterium]MBR3209452.1 phospho-N-acetylmuramoyl-pentapeptide-transferase [Bacilli bacterium]